MFDDLEALSIRSCKRMSVIARQALEEYVSANKDAKLIDLTQYGCTNGADRPINFMATPSMYRDVEVMSYKSNMPIKTMSSVFRQALAEYIERNKELFT